MKLTRNLLTLIVCVLFWAVSAFGQTSDTKQFNKDGLTFDYPSGWTLNDTSNKDAQQMTMGRSDSDVQITIFVFRPFLTTPARTAEAKKVLVDKYVAATSKSFEQAGAHPVSSPAASEIGGVPSEGVKIRASLDGIPGVAEIQWAVVGLRLVVLTFLGPDRALAKAQPAWDTVRTTIKIAAPAPAPAPSPQPQPQPSPSPKSTP